ncbi:MAG: hypothetical protein C0625_01770 [Arcobacter sp.]|nr:MAG: hypothetical protein C0625_01770 [Arcobacter sp.]
MNRRGRPKSDDPKIKLDNVRLKTSTLIDIELIADKLDITQSELIRSIIEKEVKILKSELNIKVLND